MTYASHDDQDLAEQEERIRRQEALIARMTQAGAPVEKATDRLLQMQLLHLDLRDQIARQQRH